MPGAPPSPQLVPIEDVLNGAPQLAKCKTTGELLALKPDIGAVTIGGNRVSLQHHLDDKANLQVVAKASYVAKACFVGSSSDAKSFDTLHLQHGATVKDLKRAFFERHKSRDIAPALAATGLQGASEHAALEAIVCRDVDGCFLAEDAKLPQATSSACSDIGYHGQFFLDVAPPSLRRSHVKGRLNVTAASIDDFVKVPHALGAWPHQSQSYPGGYRAIRQEMGERLQSVTRGVPAALPAAPFHNASTAFQVIIDQVIIDSECGSNMPLAFRRYASELAQEVQSKSFDSLDVAIPEAFASHLLAVLPFVEKLARVQTKDEWVTYNTETAHEEGLALSDIVSELKKLRDSIKQHVRILICALHWHPFCVHCGFAPSLPPLPHRPSPV